jgi:clan AA aspartic protease
MNPQSSHMIDARLEISNPRESALSSLKVNALVDTGARFAILPQHMATQLKLEPSSHQPSREVTLADGSSKLVPYVGPITIKFENRTCYTGALIMGDEAILGLTAMGDMDLVVFTEEKRLAVNPESPNVAMAYAKGLKANFRSKFEYHITHKICGVQAIKK